MRSSSMLKAAAAILVAGTAIFACTVDNDNPPAPVGGTGGTTTEGGVGGTAGTAGSAGTAGTAGGSQGGSAGTGGSSQTCTKITVKDLERSTSSGADGAVITGTPDPALGGADPDSWSFQLYEGNGKQAPGTFDLSSSTDANYKSCDHCVLVFQDINETAQTIGKYYFQESGELTMTVNGSPMTGKVKGSLKNVKLIEVTIASDYTSTPVANGACLEIDSLDIDTTVPVADAGTPCENATDCGDTDIMICDPNQKSCQPGQCDGDQLACTAGQQCLGQVDSPTIGACYTACTWPNTTECAGGQSCILDLAGAKGTCWVTGTGTADGACAPAASAISSRCIDGYACMTEGTNSACRKMCDYWGTPGCTSGNCTPVGSVCTAQGENVLVGAACTTAGNGCQPVNGKYEGVCTSGKCWKYCRMSGSDCVGSQVCTELAEGAGIGICKEPVPEGWDVTNCPPGTYFQDGQYCDCKCGAWDVDCDDPTLEAYDCDQGQVCLSVGVCGAPEAGGGG